MKPFKYIHCEDIGDEQFFFAENRDGKKFFVHADKHGYFNIFEDIASYAQYLRGDLSCKRIVLSPDFRPNNIEGVDALDEFLANYKH